MNTKINIINYPNIWFTSDWHLGHNKDFLYGPRGCTGRDEHVSMLINGINDQAGPDDLIIHLGDMSLTARYSEFLKWIGKINCKNIWSLYGNHTANFNNLISDLEANNPSSDFINSSASDYDSFFESYTLKNKKVVCLDDFQELSIIEPSDKVGVKARKTSVTICHFPLQIWNKSQHGSFHLCGHSHGSFDQTSLEAQTGKRFDCGVENALKYHKKVMFEWQDVKDIMKTKELCLADHHNKETT